MVIDPINVMLLFSATIVIGYVGNLIFTKTRIPDALWLLIFGFLISNSFLGIVNRESLLDFAPFMGAVALVIILFDAGLHMNFFHIIKDLPRSMVLMILGVAFNIMGVAVLAFYLLNFNWLQAFLLGTIISGTSAEMILPLLKNLKIKEKIRNILNIETIAQDPLTIVLTIILIQYIVLKSTTIPFASTLASAFSIAIVSGFIGGILWIIILDKIKGRDFDYMLTLAVLFLLYVGVEMIGGNGAIAGLLFGLVLGNSEGIMHGLKFKKKFKIDNLLTRMQTEITFFITTFFFVFTGVIAVLTLSYVLYGILLSAILIIARIIAVKIAIIKLDVTPLENSVMKIMVPRGLTTAVLAQLPLAYGLANGEFYLNITFIVIFATIIYTSLATRHFYKPSKYLAESKQRKYANRVKGKGNKEKSPEIVPLQPEDYGS